MVVVEAPNGIELGFLLDNKCLCDLHLRFRVNVFHTPLIVAAFING